jgi:hypothetical protein
MEGMGDGVGTSTMFHVPVTQIDVLSKDGCQQNTD